MKILVYLATERSIIEFRKGFFKCWILCWAWQADQKIPFLPITGSVCNGNLSYLPGILLVICDLLTKFCVNCIEIANVMSTFVYINTWSIHRCLSPFANYPVSVSQREACYLRWSAILKCMQYGGIQAAIAGGTIECKHKMQIPLLKIIPSTALISFASLDPKYDFFDQSLESCDLEKYFKTK